MQNLSDNELDDLFRKAALGSGEDSGGVDAWSALSGKVAAHNRSVLRWTGLRKGLLVVVAGGLLLYTGVKPFVKIDSSEMKTTFKENLVSDQPVKENEYKNDAEVLSRESVDQNTVQTSDLQTDIKVLGNKAPAATQKVESVASKAVVMNDSKQENQPVDQNVVLPALDLSTPVDSKPHKEISPTLSKTNEPEMVDETVHESLEDNMNAGMDETADKENKQRDGTRSAMAVKLTVSPDFSSIGFTSSKGIGLNYGVLVEFHFADKFSIATGAIRSQKVYTASNIEYSGNKADWLDGNCRIWDIPITVYYHAAPSSRFSFFTGVGISSYIMSKEQYVYTVSYYNTAYQYEQHVEGKNREWLKMLNLSVGVEHRLTPHIELQFEPFLKAPLAGVGEGDVSLASLGAFFSLKYNFRKSN